MSMSKSIIQSIKPRYCELIAAGKKTIEVRKTRPKLDVPFKVYIYCTKGENLWKKGNSVFLDKRYNRLLQTFDHMLNGKVIGEYVCDNIDYHSLSNLIIREDAEDTLRDTCITKDEVLNYLGYEKGTSIFNCKNYDFYGWHISDLRIYDKPKELSEFYHYCGDNPECKNCSYLYVESNEDIGTYEQCCSNNEGCKPLTHPPQSWCYVEEV